jgi:hypothetical protein
MPIWRIIRRKNIIIPNQVDVKEELISVSEK